VKKRKSTGTADAIQGLTQSINNFGDNICKVLAMDPALCTPNQRKEAIKLAQREVWLSMPDCLVFCNILEKDVAVIDAYAGLDHGNEEFCQMWIQQKVDNAKGVV
jgi:hypothetical protein